MWLVMTLFAVAFFSTTTWMWYMAVHRFLRLRHGEMRMRLWCCLQDGRTALMLAAVMGRDAVVNTLLDKGADMSDTDKVRSPLIQKNSHR